jgi:outer membrane protein TolC
MKGILFILLLLCIVGYGGTAILADTITVYSAAQMQDYALKKSKISNIIEINSTQSRRLYLASLMGITDPTGQVSASFTNNTQLPVSVFPAETFGGQPGTFRQITMGVQYVSSLQLSTEIKLLNLQAWEYFNQASINKQLTQIENRQKEKALLSQINELYFSIVLLQQQQISARDHYLIADSIYRLALEKSSLGFMSRKELNEMELNLVQADQDLLFIQNSLQKQYLALSVACDSRDTIIINHKFSQSDTMMHIPQMNTLDNQAEALKSDKYASYLSQQQLAFAPSISFFYNSGLQQFNSRGVLFDNSIDWIPSSALGFKLSFSIPNAANILSISQAETDYELQKIKQYQQQLQSQQQFRNLLINDHEARQKLQTQQKIYRLRMENYTLMVQSFKNGNIGSEPLLNSYSQLVQARYSMEYAMIMLLKSAQIILLNNNFH